MALFSDVLLTADYDRTLTDFAGQVPRKNIEAIRYFMENGGAFTVNTGRSVPFSREIMEKIPMNAAFLGYNGSLAMENGDRDTTSSFFRSLVDVCVVSEVCATLQSQNLGNSCGQGSLTMVNVTDGTDVYVGFSPSFKLFLCHD